MAFKPNKVKDIKEYTQKQVIQIADAYRLMMDKPEETIDETQVVIYEGIPISTTLYTYIQELQKCIRGIKFGLSYDCRTSDKNVPKDPTGYYWVRVIQELEVYMDEGAYVLGRVGHSDYSVSKPKNGKVRVPSYMVYARTIINDKYDSYRDQHNMVTSKTMSIAVSAGKKYLTSYSPIDIVKVVCEKVSDGIRSSVSKRRRVSVNAREKLMEDNVIKELKTLVDSGYSFLYADVEEHVKNAISAYDEYETYRNNKTSGKYVIVSNQLGVQMFDVVPTDNTPYSGELDWTKLSSIRYRADEVPEDILGRVAVLSMAQNYEYIEGVGNRLGDTVFWIQDEA